MILPEGIRRTSLSSSNGMMPPGCEPRWLMDFWHWRFARLVLHPEIVAHSDQLGVAFPHSPKTRQKSAPPPAVGAPKHQRLTAFSFYRESQLESGGRGGARIES